MHARRSVLHYQQLDFRNAATLKIAYQAEKTEKMRSLQNKIAQATCIYPKIQEALINLRNLVLKEASKRTNTLPVFPYLSHHDCT